MLIVLSKGAPNRKINQELDFTQDLKTINGSRTSDKSCKNFNKKQYKNDKYKNDKYKYKYK